MAIPLIAWPLLALGAGALLWRPRVELAPGVRARPGNWYRLELDTPVANLDQAVGEIQAIGFEQVRGLVQERTNPRRWAAFARFREKGPGAQFSRVTALWPLVLPPAVPPPPSIVDEGMPGPLANATSTALAVEGKPDALAAFAEVLRPEYPIAARQLQGKADAIEIAAGRSLAPVPAAAPAPRVSGGFVGILPDVSGGLVGILPLVGPLLAAAAPAAPAIAAGAGAYALSPALRQRLAETIDAVGKSPILRSALEATRDFSNTPTGRDLFRAMATTGFYLTSTVTGYPIIASAFFALPGLVRGDDFDKAYAEELGWRVQKTAEYFAGESGKNIAAVGTKEADQWLKDHPEVRAKVEQLGGLFKDQIASAAKSLKPLFDRTGITGLTQKYGSPPNLRQIADELGIREDAAGYAWDLVTRNASLSTVKGRQYDVPAGKDLSGFSRGRLTVADIRQVTDELQAKAARERAEREEAARREKAAREAAAAREVARARAAAYYELALRLHAKGGLP